MGHTGIEESSLLTAKEVASRLRMPISTVYHLTKTGHLAGVQIGKTWRFRAQDIEAIERGQERGGHILVVDDDATVLTFLSSLLEEAGHKVRTASTAAAAEHLIQNRHFDLLLVDVVLPDRTGVDLINALPPEFPRHRVILMTAHADLPSVSNILSWDQLTILRKPIEPVPFMDCVGARLALRAR